MEKVVKKSVKSRIVTAAWQLFYEKGYNGTTVDDIIELSGTPKVLSITISARRMSFLIHYP